MDEERLDLSAIDPSHDHEHWDRLVRSVASRGWAAHRARVSVHLQLVSWARPVLAVAAMVALFSWAGALSAPRASGIRSASSEDPVVALAKWSQSDALPSTDRVLYVMGEGDAVE